VSSLIYPTLPGLSIEIQRSYDWKTQVQEALSGKQSAQALRQWPLIHYELEYNVLRDVGAPGYGGITTSEIAALVGLYNQMQGRWDTFLFTDPDFNTATSSNQQLIGTSTGSTATTYQLVAYYQNVGGPGNDEIIQNLNGTPVLYDNGAIISATHYTIGPTGVVTFTTSPASGHTITWSGSWYYRCRFDEDAIVWKRFMSKLWAASVKFTSVKL
jgi:uncharacterized protein (TIGR02217 family)